MNEIVLASHNQNKVQEFRQIFCSKKIVSLNEIGFDKEIKETGLTLEENALIKVRKVFDFSKDEVATWRRARMFRMPGPATNIRSTDHIH